MKKLFASKLISFLSLILFIINIFIVWSVYSIHSSLERDANLISNIGFIRGSTQRILKFELLKNIDSADYSVSEVDKIFDIYVAEGKSSEFRFDPEIFQPFKSLYGEWNAFKDILYKNRSENQQFLQELSLMSESIWSGSNSLMLRKVIGSDRKTSNIKKLYYYVFFLFASSFIFYMISKFFVQKVEHSSCHDSLTSIYNRSQFDMDIKEEIDRYDRNKREFSLFIMDIDHFKKVNDSLGHAEGDRVLKKMAGTVRQHIRKTDFFYRIGGEEFAVLSPETDRESALLLAEKIRSSVKKEFSKDKSKITISIGVSVYMGGISHYDYYNQADKALYEAKRTGRNKSVIFDNMNLQRSE
ncbi:diguanylate cyclase (GGDEF) domain-containing protein [Desulfomicrobium norvegicum]|uniref:diguanylate cyclase n=1 Tax=Desulfomicrobium norvegicum (strain DSM 1741 / NCIMB 8310) TaxID=52561 RepID=A0A8G2C4T0_DESNO|nr:GGDEF domain-containing protein [Desulfomicrobium norvegicum]SFM01865.1 diguanylate cyclase (GGDEF) domain-containing protein [Desulfomicrobium norvegicum]